MSASRATSLGQYSASVEGRVPPVDEVRDGVWSLPLPMPGNALVPYTLGYLVVDDRGGVHVIDPGLDRDENWDVLVAGLASAGCRLGDVASIVVTHLHRDHLGMAERLRGETGAPLVLHNAEQSAIDATSHPDEESTFAEWGVPVDRRDELRGQLASPTSTALRAPADLLLDDGDRLDVPGRTIDVMHTPGHTVGHICLRDSSGLVFTGDHVLPHINPGLGLGGVTGTDPIADYLTSLERVARFDADEVCPGHGYRFRGLAERCAALAAHHRARSAEIGTVAAECPQATVWQIAERVGWSAGWAGLHGFTLASALAQTGMHLEHLGSDGSATKATALGSGHG